MRWEGKPFGYLEGMVAEPDAPEQDNPARLYCPKCRQDGRLVCDEPGVCGELRPMRPLPTPPEEAKPGPAPHPMPPVCLDESRGIRALHDPHPPRHVVIPDFPGRIMGRRTELKPLPDGVEMTWDWFMEQVTPEDWP